jgi:hypothetical protein
MTQSGHFRDRHETSAYGSSAGYIIDLAQDDYEPRGFGQGADQSQRRIRTPTGIARVIFKGAVDNVRSVFFDLVSMDFASEPQDLGYIQYPFASPKKCM